MVGIIASETAWLVSCGLVVGLIASCFLRRLIESELFGVTPTDPVIVIASVGIVALIGLLAATLPAWRASHIDPALALRGD